MAKTFSAFYLGSILAIMLFVVVVMSNGYASYNKAFAAINSSSVSTPKAKQDTFSAIGTISSLVITVPTPSKSIASAGAGSGFNITNAFKVILAGDWNLSVRNGNITNFAANFLASPMDGSKPHIHQITNFQKAHTMRQQQMVQLALDNTISINGTVDVKINGVIVWDNARVSIQILKGNTIAIRLNDKDTEDHFGAQAVFGVVNRLVV